MANSKNKAIPITTPEKRGQTIKHISNIKTVLILFFLTCLTYGQSTKTSEKMNLSNINNQIVKKAIEALQNADKTAWFSLFTDNAALYDDGNKQNFKSFFEKAIGHERFTSIDKIENNSLSVYGKFHSDTWGNFKTYFKFQINEKGKITRLDIGQAKY
ncbi:hypothetical protein [Flavobacterium sp. JAS]|uniref:hypothetical protein n=1 Tax=Flavobacterium sp. JAS TaxID=2897329 RepID=UPI001E2A54E3|nr:hypothetical protein [Flavobacterium sp. JAS]MCD0471421.1 hypothetical protein [Flavobacterium sp. JAS]